jgi:nicotinate phosphoribosyltransferase
VAKLSAAKATLPGPKQVWRRPGPAGDVIGLADEDGPRDGEPILVPALRDGRRLVDASLDAARDRFASELEGLPASLRSLDAKAEPPDLTPGLRGLAERVRDRIRARELG